MIPSMDLTTDCLEVLHHRVNYLAALNISHVEILSDTGGKSGTWVISEIEDFLNDVRAQVIQLAHETRQATQGDTEAISNVLDAIDRDNPGGYSTAAIGKPLSRALQDLYLKGLTSVANFITPSKLLALIALGGTGVWVAWHASHVKPTPPVVFQNSTDPMGMCAAVMDKNVRNSYLATLIPLAHEQGNALALLNFMQDIPHTESTALDTLSGSSANDFAQISVNLASMAKTIGTAYAVVSTMPDVDTATVTIVNKFMGSLMDLLDQRGSLPVYEFYFKIVECFSQTSSVLSKEVGTEMWSGVSSVSRVLDKYISTPDAAAERFATNTANFEKIMSFLPKAKIKSLLAHRTTADVLVHIEQNKKHPEIGLEDAPALLALAVQQFRVCASLGLCQAVSRQQALLQLTPDQQLQVIQSDFLNREQDTQKNAADYFRVSRGNDMFHAEAQRFILHLQRVNQIIGQGSEATEVKESMQSYAVQIFSAAYFHTRMRLDVLTSKSSHIEDVELAQTVDLYFNQDQTWTCRQPLTDAHIQAVHLYIGELAMHQFYLDDLSLDAGVKDFLTLWATTIPRIAKATADGGVVSAVVAAVSAVPSVITQATTADIVKRVVDKAGSLISGGPSNERWVRDNLRSFCFEDFLKSQDFITISSPHYSKEIPRGGPDLPFLVGVGVK